MASARKNRTAIGALGACGPEGGRDAHRLDALINLHAREIQLFLYKLCGDHHDAEELAQDVFVKAFRRLESLREPAAARRWLYAIAVNHFNDWLKPQRRRFLRAQSSLESRDVAAAISEKPVKETLARELSDTLMSCVQDLPNRQRVVLLMYSAKGFGYAEIGEALGITADAVKMSLFYAREKLRGQIEKLVD
ncbi:MAG: RNA polymerase sigma factor [Planctomycetota bacterium]